MNKFLKDPEANRISKLLMEFGDWYRNRHFIIEGGGVRDLLISYTKKIMEVGKDERL